MTHGQEEEVSLGRILVAGKGPEDLVEELAFVGVAHVEFVHGEVGI